MSMAALLTRMSISPPAIRVAAVGQGGAPRAGGKVGARRSPPARRKRRWRRRHVAPNLISPADDDVRSFAGKSVGKAHADAVSRTRDERRPVPPIVCPW